MVGMAKPITKSLWIGKRPIDQLATIEKELKPGATFEVVETSHFRPFWFPRISFDFHPPHLDVQLIRGFIEHIPNITIVFAIPGMPTRTGKEVAKYAEPMVFPTTLSCVILVQAFAVRWA